MLKRFNPDTVVKPFSNYSQGVAAPAGARWLYVSGQVGAKPDGTIEKGFEAQAARCWSNIIAILAAEGMGPADIVKNTVFITNAADVAKSRVARDAAMQGHACASTLVVVSALAVPELVVEIEVVAAK
ncbi:MAG: RidA family protein [Rhodospirillaceae bacterium]|nr:RidA family protein [Rhodospirillaceae bacterium]